MPLEIGCTTQEDRFILCPPSSANFYRSVPDSCSVAPWHSAHCAWISKRSEWRGRVGGQRRRTCVLELQKHPADHQPPTLPWPQILFPKPYWNHHLLLIYMFVFFNAFLFIWLQVIRTVLQIIRKAVDFSCVFKGSESEARAAETHLRWYEAGWKRWMEETAAGSEKAGCRQSPLTVFSTF